MDHDREAVVSYVNDVVAMFDARLRNVEGKEGGMTDREYDLWGRLIATELLLGWVIRAYFHESARADMEEKSINSIDKFSESMPAPLRGYFKESLNRVLQ